jgi:hypothetical protein
VGWAIIYKAQWYVVFAHRHVKDAMEQQKTVHHAFREALYLIYLAIHVSLVVQLDILQSDFNVKNVNLHVVLVQIVRAFV